MSIRNINRIKVSNDKRSKSSLTETTTFQKMQQQNPTSILRTELLKNLENFDEIIKKIEKILNFSLHSVQSSLLTSFKNSIKIICQKFNVLSNTYMNNKHEQKLNKKIAKLQNEVEFYRNQSLVLMQIKQNRQNQIHQLKLIIQSLQSQNLANKQKIQNLKKLPIKSRQRRTQRLKSLNILLNNQFGNTSNLCINTEKSQHNPICVKKYYKKPKNLKTQLKNLLIYSNIGSL